MRRRTFFHRLFASLGAAITGPNVPAQEATMVIQESPIAGFQFHRGQHIWASLAVGDQLRLVREASNEHDPDAVAVYRGDDQLGYVPRGENRTIAQMLDHGQRLEAKITRLSDVEDPWKRLRITIFLGP